MNTKVRFLLGWTLLALAVSGCMPAAEEFIQGTWTFDNPHFFGLTGESRSITTWQFSGGIFYFESCCFNMDEAFSGRYRLVEYSETELVLELFNMEGATRISYGTLDPVRVWIEIDAENDTLELNSAGPYVRVLP